MLSLHYFRYKAIDERESEHICERVVPQLQHANGSVVLSAVKVSLLYQLVIMPLESPDNL